MCSILTGNFVNLVCDCKIRSQMKRRKFTYQPSLQMFLPFFLDLAPREICLFPKIKFIMKKIFTFLRSKRATERPFRNAPSDGPGVEISVLIFIDSTSNNIKYHN